MYKILKNKAISKTSFLMEIEAPLVTKHGMPGQFVILMTKEDSERIPLTIYDIDKENNILKVIYQVVGGSTLELSKEKEELFSVVGPLGKPNAICKNPDTYEGKKLVYVAGGVGIAPAYPQVKYLKEKGFKVDVIFGARNKDSLIIRDEIEKIADRVFYTTDDGSYGAKGFVTDILSKRIKKYDICIVMGPLIMLKNISELTKGTDLKTIVSLDPIMIDGTGMCGGCRCEVDGKTKFACVDGPEFDGHKVDFDNLMKRMNAYKDEEFEKYEMMKKRLGD